ncbi:MAG: hypothetical protein IIC71_11810 [Acidobacteria bacterium]|nr:hypothetical protein [Acidobacteriota bacterium]
MMKKALTLLLTIGLLAFSAGPVLAAEESDRVEETKKVKVEDKRTGKDEGKVELKTKRTAAVVEGDTAWVAFSWKAKRTDATDFKIAVTTESRGVTIEYPANTASYSSLMDNDTLSANEIDFTSVRLSVPYGSKNIKLKVVATWVQDGKNDKQNYEIKVPVAKFKGDDIAQATTDAGSVSVGEPAWLGVEWTGLAPVLSDIEITVTGPLGTAITYPADRPFTSLYYNDSLEDGETDVARFLIDATAMSPGSYVLTVEVSYTKAGTAKSVSGEVSFKVTG